MSNTRDIRRRIRSVKNTQQITKAMELVAASKMKRAQQSAVAGRSYATLMAEMLASLSGRADVRQHPFLVEREVKTRGILLVTSDRGLCGPLNSNLFRLVTEAAGDISYTCIGRKGAQFLGRTARDLKAEFSIADNVPFSEVRVVAEFMTKQFLEGEIDTIEILYSKFVNTLVQKPTLHPLLPLSNLQEMIERLGTGGQAGEGENGKLIADPRDMTFEPDPASVLADLLPLYINQQIYHFVLDAKASEHSARMVAMKTASDNAADLLDDLTLAFNKARQAAITQEILEISASAAANA